MFWARHGRHCTAWQHSTNVTAGNRLVAQARKTRRAQAEEVVTKDPQGHNAASYAKHQSEDAIPGAATPSRRKLFAADTAASYSPQRSKSHLQNTERDASSTATRSETLITDADITYLGMDKLTSQPAQPAAQQVAAAPAHKASIQAAQQGSKAAPPQQQAAEQELEEGGEEELELEEGEEQLQLSEARHIITEPNFLKHADALRAVFDSRFADPRHTSKERFLWDYWHIPDQYTLIRTQAQVYFPPKLYEALEDALLQYGEQHLGCRAITPIWLSYYIDGCCQELHCDNPHGPFAFVLSLTNWEERIFEGGQTMIIKPHILGSYWQDFNGQKGQEMKDLLTLVEPHFNQLLVFDPRFPHGVRPVRGTRDPLQSRLVLHGWFADPSPFFEGALKEKQAVPALNAATEELYEQLAQLPPATGLLTVRMTIRGSDGRVDKIEWLADTLVPLDPAENGGDVRAEIQHAVHDTMTAAKFPKVKNGGNTRITLPLVFQ